MRARNFLLSFAAVALLVILGTGMFVLGLSLGGQVDSRNALREQLPDSIERLLFGHPGLFPLQQEVLEKLRTSYYRDIDPVDLEDDTIRGMLDGLDDPYTTYFSPKEFASFREHTEGQYSGLGMVVEMKNGFVTVVSTFKGSPAERGGIRPGDLIISVDGKTTRSASLDEVVDRIKGPEGSKVKLQTYRLPAGATTTAPPSDQDEDVPLHLPEGGSTQDLELERQEIVVPVVETETREVGGKKVAVIRFTTFTDGSHEELRKAVVDAIEEGDADAVVLDLRSNGGGLLSEAIDVASIFIPEGVVVTTEGLFSPKEVYNVRGGAVGEDVPLYVLVDGFSASAAEIVAGALKDTDRGTLVGETTFGKGLVQTVEPLSNGGALKVTSAVYLTPSGRDINQKGIEPDVTAPDKPETEADETLEKTLDLIAAAR